MGKSILIIDDDRDFRNSLKHVLECNDYKVYEAGNGKEGIESYRRINTDLVITDIYMPEKDGLETIKELRKEFPEARIIAISGGYKDSGNFLHIARTFGAIDCIRKPFKPDDLIRIVNLTLDGNASAGAV
ncbi:MAG: response regulator [Dissulfurispiraceae bacterium]